MTKRIHASIFVLIKLILSLIAVSASKPVGIATTVSRVNKIVSIRGGAGPLNAKDTAKVAAYVVGVQGAYGVLAPAKSNEACGLPSNPLDDFLQTRSSTLILSLYLLIRELALKGASLNKAVGISAIPPLVHIVQSLLNGDAVKLGFNINTQYLLLIFWALVAYSSLNGTKYADGLVKAFAVANVGLGLYVYFFPTESIKLFGRTTQPVSTSNKVQLRTLAALALSNGIIISSILWRKVDALKAIGYGWVPIVLHSLNGLFLNKEFVELRLNQGVLLVSLVLNLIVAVTLGL